jgi:hypothetical protein
MSDYTYGKAEDQLLNDIKKTIWGNGKKGLEEKATDIEKAIIKINTKYGFILAGIGSILAGLAKLIFWS